MEIKKFSHFIKNENYSSNTEEFMDKLINSPDIQSELKSILKLTLEKVFYVSAKVDSESLSEQVKSKATIDETNLLEFSVDTQIDLCCYAQEIDGGKCPSVDWELLLETIGKFAISGLNYIFDELVEGKFTPKFNKFMEDNQLQYSRIRHTESFGSASPNKVIPIENGEINQYRKLDGSYNVDEYIYRDEELNIELYIIKEI